MDQQSYENQRHNKTCLKHGSHATAPRTRTRIASMTGCYEVKNVVYMIHGLHKVTSNTGSWISSPMKTNATTKTCPKQMGVMLQLQGPGLILHQWQVVMRWRMLYIWSLDSIKSLPILGHGSAVLWKPTPQQRRIILAVQTHAILHWPELGKTETTRFFRVWADPVDLHLTIRSI